MDLTQIMSEWEEDSIINELELQSEALKTGKVQSKYLSYLSKARLTSKKLYSQYKERKDWKRRYFRGEFNNADDLKLYNIEPYRGSSLAAEIENKLEADKELIDILLKKDYYDEIVLFCEAVVKELNNRTYAIGNATKLYIFMNGGN